MADLTRPWRRLLALPSESRAKTLLVAFAVSALCAAAVTTATSVLRPIQAANRAAQERVRLEALLSAIPGMDPVLAEAGGDALSAVVVDLSAGRAARDVAPADLAAALEDPARWRDLPPEEDVAGIGARPDLAQAYILRDGEDVTLLILPVIGSGYNGPIRAMLALAGDMETIAGFAVTDHSETPGLGARIGEGRWQAGFAGTRIEDPSGETRFRVAAGPARTEYEVDGITGATRTGSAVTRMVRFWTGPLGYGPLIEAVRRGEF